MAEAPDKSQLLSETTKDRAAETRLGQAKKMGSAGTRTKVVRWATTDSDRSCFFCLAAQLFFSLFLHLFSSALCPFFHLGSCRSIRVEKIHTPQSQVCCRIHTVGPQRCGLEPHYPELRSALCHRLCDSIRIKEPVRTQVASTGPDVGHDDLRLNIVNSNHNTVGASKCKSKQILTSPRLFRPLTTRA